MRFDKVHTYETTTMINTSILISISPQNILIPLEIHPFLYTPSSLSLSDLHSGSADSLSFSRVLCVWNYTVYTLVSGVLPPS